MKERPLGCQLVRLSLPAIAVLGFLSSACGGAALEEYSESPDSPNKKPTPDLITPSATATETPLPTTTPTPQPTETPTATATTEPTKTPKSIPTPASFKVGDHVMVVGTGSCLARRDQPSLSGRVIECIHDFDDPNYMRTIYPIIGGPVTADGHVWWKFPMGGWSVQDYLQKWPTPIVIPSK